MPPLNANRAILEMTYEKSKKKDSVSNEQVPYGSVMDSVFLSMDIS